jgi:hypothetical protein
MIVCPATRAGNRPVHGRRHRGSAISIEQFPDLAEVAQFGVTRIVSDLLRLPAESQPVAIDEGHRGASAHRRDRHRSIGISRNH